MSSFVAFCTIYLNRIYFLHSTDRSATVPWCLTYTHRRDSQKTMKHPCQFWTGSRYFLKPRINVNSLHWSENALFQSRNYVKVLRDFFTDVYDSRKKRNKEHLVHLQTRGSACVFNPFVHSSHKRDISKQGRPISDAANAASDQGLRCLH